METLYKKLVALESSDVDTDLRQIDEISRHQKSLPLKTRIMEGIPLTQRLIYSRMGIWPANRTKEDISDIGDGMVDLVGYNPGKDSPAWMIVAGIKGAIMSALVGGAAYALNSEINPIIGTAATVVAFGLPLRNAYHHFRRRSTVLYSRAAYLDERITKLGFDEVVQNRNIAKAIGEVINSHPSRNPSSHSSA
jgi:hypothetical protein